MRRESRSTGERDDFFHQVLRKRAGLFTMEGMTAYEKLCQARREVALLQSIGSTLGWDQETFLPEGGLAHRAQALSWVSTKAHALATGKPLRKLLDAAEKENLRGLKERLNVEQIRWEVERAVRLPSRLVAEETEATSLAKHAWAAARQRSDFKAFSPHLEKLLEIARRKADLWGWRDEPYDALLEEYERGAHTREVAELFADLRPRLAKLARAAVERSEAMPGPVLKGPFPIHKQQILNAEIAASAGFDFQRGRIDTTAHPFCTTLGPGDVRLTTRYDEKNFLSSLFGVLHEAGHGMYEQGLPAADFGLPSGQSVSLGIHESQSRLWENHAGRSLPFWEKWLPRAAELFPGLRKVRLEDFMRLVNRARFSFIRVEADEATYDLHILLRFEIERRLVGGNLAVRDVPEAWNETFRELFGLTPPDDARGCLQDIHWSMGGIGYFATYTLGNLNAAQLFHAATRQAAVRKAFAAADYAPLLSWLRARIHERGGLLPPSRIMEDATGKPVSARYHLRHLRERFLG
jgi:carboxypeptidase Taq